MIRLSTLGFSSSFVSPAAILLCKNGQRPAHNHNRTDAETAAKQKPRETEPNRRSDGNSA